MKNTVSAPKGFIALIKSTRSKGALATLYKAFLSGNFRATNPKTLRRQKRALRSRIESVGLPKAFA
jgi:hypothetical protein